MLPRVNAGRQCQLRANGLRVPKRNPGSLQLRLEQRLQQLVVEAVDAEIAIEASGAQRRASKALGLATDALNRIYKGERAGSIDSVDKVCEHAGVDWRYFFDEDLGDRTSYLEWKADAKPSATPADSDAWRKFLRVSGSFRLGKKQTEWLRAAAFRGAAPTVDDYVNLAIALTREPTAAPGFEAAEKAEASAPRKK